MAAAIAAMVLTATVALAGPTAEKKCEAAKNSAAGKYAACRQAARKGVVSTGDTAKYDAAIAKCETKFAEAWQKAIDSASSAGVTCTDAALAASDYKSVIDRHTSNIATALAGGELVTGSCGNGIIDADEDCDFGAPGDQTCDGATAGAAPYGTVSCGAGCTSSTSSCFACPGKNFGGSCWRFGAQGASCTDTCANVGMSYDSATKTFAGSDGTAENCSALAQAIFSSYTSPPAPTPWSYTSFTSTGVGCSLVNGAPPHIYRDTNPTLGDATNSSFSRFCACH